MRLDPKPPALPLLLALALGSAFAAPLTGAVRDGKGSAVAGARLYLAPLVTDAAPCGFGTVSDSMASGSDGSFRFDAASGFYALRVVKSGFNEACDFLEVKDSGASREVVLSTGGNPGATITGIALLAGTRQRLPGIRFVWADFNWDTVSLVTDANGEFRKEGVAPKDEYFLHLRDDRYMDWGTTLYDLSAGQIRTVRVELEAAPGPIGDPGSVSGIVTDLFTGKPVAGAMVTLEEAKTQSRNRHIDSVLSDAQGAYRFDGVPAVTELGFGYVLLARFPRYNLGVTDLFNVQPKEALTKNVGMAKIMNLAVSVKEKGSDRPLPKAQVSLQSSGNGSSLFYDKTDTAGSLVFKSVALGEARITVALNGYRTAFVRKIVSGFAWDESVSVALEAIPAGESKSIQGVPRASGNSGLAGIPVFFRAAVADGSPLVFGYSLGDGSFAIEGIPGACASGDLFSPYGDSLALTLTGAVTQVAFSVGHPPIAEANTPLRAGALKRPPTGWFRGYNLLGRRARWNPGPTGPVPGD